ncbi:MAG: magnesium transporter [Cytophagaceae bacterium]
MQFELTHENLDQLKEAVAQKQDALIIESIQELHARDISVILHELELEESQYILSLLPQDEAGQVIRELDPDYRRRFLKLFRSEQIAGFINYIDSDDAVDIINEQPVKTREEVIALVDNREKADHIRDLIHYDEDCAGGLMAKELIRANINWTVTQCIEEIRRQTKNVSRIYSVYVVDNNDKLVGIVSLKKMLLAEDETLIADIYEPDIISVETFREAEEVAQIMERYDLEAVPVVNVHGKLLGRITIDDIVDVIKERAEQDIQLMAGISEPVEEDDSVWTLSRARLPWLMIGMAGGMLGARFIGLFENDISLIPAMAFFIPLITATGGNVGIQSSSVVVQSLAKESGKSTISFERIFKGFMVAALNGIVLSGIVFTINFFTMPDYKLAFVVSLALLSVIILASLMGTVTPLILEKLGFNPALAAGPFITTANDLLGLAIYFLVAKALMTV